MRGKKGGKWSSFEVSPGVAVAFVGAIPEIIIWFVIPLVESYRFYPGFKVKPSESTLLRKLTARKRKDFFFKSSSFLLKNKTAFIKTRSYQRCIDDPLTLKKNFLLKKKCFPRFRLYIDSSVCHNSGDNNLEQISIVIKNLTNSWKELHHW